MTKDKPTADMEREIQMDRRSLLLTGAAATFASLSLPGSAAAAPAGDKEKDRGDTTEARPGTITAPRYYDRIDYKKDDFGYKQQNYSYMSSKGPVIGLVSSMVCVIDRPAKDVWHFLKDYNTWEGPFGIKWSRVWGDLYTNEDHSLGKETFTYGAGGFTSVPCEAWRAIPEHLMVMYETIPKDGSTDGMSPGFHVTMLNEHAGKSYVNKIMEHAERLKYKTEEEAMDNSRWGPNKYDFTMSLSRFRDQFVPKLKELATAGRPKV